MLGIDQKTVSNDLRRQEYSSLESAALEAGADVDEEYSSPEEFADASYEVGPADIGNQHTGGRLRRVPHHHATRSLLLR